MPAPAAPGPALGRPPQRQPLLFPPGAGPLAPLCSAAGLGHGRVGGGGAARGCSSCFPAAGRRTRGARPGPERERGVRAPQGSAGVGRRVRGAAAASSPPAAAGPQRRRPAPGRRRSACCRRGEGRSRGHPGGGGLPGNKGPRGREAAVAPASAEAGRPGDIVGRGRGRTARAGGWA